MTAATHDRRGRPLREHRPGTREQAAAVLSFARRIASPQPAECVECGAETVARFGVAPLCDDHRAEAMATAYAMEIGGAL